MWSGAARSTPINDKTDRKKPSAWRKGNRKTRRSVNAVSIAQSENVFGAPGRPDGDGRHASVASAESHRVTSPRWTKACSYADQFPTRSFALYFGWTFDLMSRSCTRSGHRGQRAYSCLVAAEGLCTNAGFRHGDETDVPAIMSEVGCCARERLNRLGRRAGRGYSAQQSLGPVDTSDRRRVSGSGGQPGRDEVGEIDDLESYGEEILLTIRFHRTGEGTDSASRAQSHRVSDDVLRPEARQFHGQRIETDAGKRFCDLDVKLDTRRWQPSQMCRAASFDATIARPNAKPALVQQDRFVHVALWILLEHDSPQCRRFSASRGLIESVTHLLGCAPRPDRATSGTFWSSSTTRSRSRRVDGENRLVVHGLPRAAEAAADDFETNRVSLRVKPR